ncbi:MAG: selenite/tellurite reduction operon b-type cytochrome membrane protein ExtQ [Trichloromonadaceae bacterium]
MNGYLRSSPHFFRLIRRAILLLVGALIAVSAWIPAPLEEQANFAVVPNPSKSAWFLLWMQELVSYSNWFIYPILLLGLLTLLLPWLPGSPPVERARWLPPEQRLVNLLTLLVFAVIVALTVLALLFRGENWSLVWPF